MQINLETDYAIRCLMYLARRKMPTSSLDIGKALMLKRSYVSKILRKLRDGGIVTVARGIMGGYLLSRPANMITLHEVLNYMEDTMKVNRCLEKDGYCSINWTGGCGARTFFCELQKALDDCMERTTIADLVNSRYTDNIRFPGDILSIIRSKDDHALGPILDTDIVAEGSSNGSRYEYDIDHRRDDMCTDRHEEYGTIYEYNSWLKEGDITEMGSYDQFAANEGECIQSANKTEAADRKEDGTNTANDAGKDAKCDDCSEGDGRLSKYRELMKGAKGA